MVWTFGAFRLDPARFELTSGGKPVEIEPQVLTLLIHLVRNNGRLVTKDEIVAAVWNGADVSDASIASRIRSARQSVGDDGGRQAVIQTVHGRGYRFIADLHATLPPHTTGEFNHSALRQKLSQPSIAVLPFQPLSLPPDLEVLSEALPHEIIQALSRLRWLAVIARGSSFRVRSSDPDVAALALGARYILSGIIEGSGRKLFVTLELIDAAREEVIWGDRLFSPLDAIEGLRQSIVNRVVSALDLHVPENEARNAAMIGTESLDAWANFHLGLHHIYRFTPDAVVKARQYFELALTLDPKLARAHAGLSFTCFLEAFLNFGPFAGEAVEAARRHAERGLEIDPFDPFTHFNMGRSFWLTAEPEKAQGWLQRAVELNPNYAQGFYAGGFTAMLIGSSNQAHMKVDTALSLSPLDPLLYGMYGVRALTLIQSKDTSEAACWGDRAASTPGAHHLISMIAAIANSMDGRDIQARRWSDEARRRRPDATIAQFLAAFPIRDDHTIFQLRGELTRLGFK